MLIKLIEPGTKTELFFAADQIRCVMPSATNPLICQVVTNWLTSTGFQTFECFGSPEGVAREINQALAGKNLLLQ